MMEDRVPPLLMTSEPGSYARYTVVERKPAIIQNTLDDNDYPPDIVAGLEAFRDEIARQPLQPLTGLAPDLAFWHRAAAPYRGRTWLELPWFFAETYFYRRLLEVVRYFQLGEWQGRDPFARQKREQENRAFSWLVGNWDQVEAVKPVTRLGLLLHSCLWGNRADLSNLAMAQQVRAGLDVGQEQHNILIDHTSQVTALLSSGLARVDVVCDNCGQELLFDLALADLLLANDWVQTMVLHLKDHPYFVSDAMPADVMALLDRIQETPTGGVGAASATNDRQPGGGVGTATATNDRQPTGGVGAASATIDGQPAGGVESASAASHKRLGRRLAAHQAAGRLVLKDDPFWTTCLMFRHMPPALATELAGADLVILKGDVNYRRLADDAHWPHTTPLEKIAAYFPASLVTLRTLKSEIMVGLEPGQAEALAAQDPEWLTDGQRGIVQYIAKDIRGE